MRLVGTAHVSARPAARPKRDGLPAQKPGRAASGWDRDGHRFHFAGFLSARYQRLDQHRFRPLGKLVVGNLDRIADVDNVGN